MIASGQWKRAIYTTIPIVGCLVGEEDDGMDFSTDLMDAVGFASGIPYSLRQRLGPLDT
jgi:hypothetical protein